MRLVDWQLRDTAPGEGRPDDIALDWVPVSAPGDTYLALHAAGRLPHPFADRNENACAWVEHREWWWRTAFEAPPLEVDERVELLFEGLDTFAAIWLNEMLLGESDNMFAGRNFDIGALLRRDGPNELRIRFTPPTLITADREAPSWDVPADHPIRGSKRNLLRKAQFGWGWDWAPSFPTVGIWQPVRVERHRMAAIRDVRFETLRIGDTARVAVTVDVEAFAGPAVASIEIRDPAGVLVVSARGNGRSEFDVPDPSLWWTPDLGGPALYTLTAILIANEREVDRRERVVGIRIVELDTSPDPEEAGCDFFRFVLNGVPIFARGANWVPASAFVGAVTPRDYETLLDLAVSANMNMIRVWGGGVYEHEAFYDACDRRGLLLWHDLMFACAPYPEDDPAFDDSIAKEMDWQVRRLRNHPCLALWCGNNEGQVIQEIMNHRAGETVPYLGDRHFRETIPTMLNDLDPSTPYRSGSPSGGPAQNSMRAGDVHDWTVWHGLPPVFDDIVDGTFDRSPAGVAYSRYAENEGRFVSEFGLMSAPALSTFARWLPPDELKLDSPALLHRIKDRPIDKVDALLGPNTGLAATLEDYVDFTQIVQAEGLKFGIEHFRRRKPHCSGALLWQLNDCWPGVSWSIVDGDGVPKPAWYAVRRAFAPVMACFRDAGGGLVELWIVNDTLGDIAIDARVTLVTMAGKTIKATEISVEATANSSGVVWRGETAAAPDHVLLVRSQAFADNRHFFAALKDLPLSHDVHVRREGNSITVTAARYAYGIGFYAGRANTRFGDNFFDLAAGESRTILIDGAGIDDVKVRLTYASHRIPAFAQATS